MFKILKIIGNTWTYCFDELADPRAEWYPLMHTPFPTILIIGLYLKFVLEWGPKFMEKRKAYNLDKLLIVYNAVQVVCCAYLLYKALKLTYFFGGYNFFCEPVDFSNSAQALEIISGGYKYFLLKLVDLLDTVFFVLRKKSRQVSFLHVYHHSGMVALTWMGMKFLPGGTTAIVVLLNSAVHMIMYGYYLVTLLFKDQRSLWWKKYITQMQIAQFILMTMTFMSAIFYPDCEYPTIAAFFMCIQNLCMSTMFLDFYYKAYVCKSVKKN